MADQFEIDGLDPSPPARAPDAGARLAAGSPGVLRRAGAGSWHVFSGLWFLLTHPRLWPLAALPAAMAVAAIMGGLVLGVFALRWLEGVLLPAPGRLPAGAALLLMIALWVGALLGAVVLCFGLALLLTAPVLERLSRHVEEHVRVQVPGGEAGWRWEVAQSLRGSLYFLTAAPVVLLLSLIPVFGPPLGLIWGAHALAMQQTDVSLSRRGLAFGQRRKWHWRHLPESLGFGATGLVLLVVPCANFLLAPALTVGGTLMVLEMEDDLVPPDR